MGTFICCLVILSGFLLFVQSEEKYGCVLPPEPLFGRFEFNDRKRSYKLVCDEDYFRTGSTFDVVRKCRNGKWSSDSEQDCMLSFKVQRQCPYLHKPRHGHVNVPSRAPGGKALFQCEEGYVLEGSSEVECLNNQMWSGEIPVCSSRKTAADLGLAMKEKFIDRYTGATTSSDTNRAQDRLSVGKSGLDIIMAVDVSSSISPRSLNIAKSFMKLMVDIFGVSERRDGGSNGTRVAVLTFSTTTSVLFNVDDRNIRSAEAAKLKIDTITNSGGGTDLANVLDTAFARVHMGKVMQTLRAGGETNKAIFLITDAEQTVRGNGMSDNDALLEIRNKASNLKNSGYEIFTLGVGKHVDEFTLAEIASTPYTEHVFTIEKFDDLKDIGDVISEKNIDYSICGISGNIELSQTSQDAKKGAWPWVGWLSAGSKTCGGALLSDRWFMTTATCVTELDENGAVVPYQGSEVGLYLGDSRLYGKDNEEIQPIVFHVFPHHNYTGQVNEVGIRDYDIALLDLGVDNNTRPVLNKFVKPICRPDDDWESFAENSLLTLKSEPQVPRGFTTGWGHSPYNLHEQYMQRDDSRLQIAQFLWGRQKQNTRAVQTDHTCRKIFNLDTDKYFCVGNQISESEACRGDIGGPYMVEIGPKRQFVALGLALKTDNCRAKNPNQFSIFLNLNHESIKTWINETMENPPIPKPAEQPEEQLDCNGGDYDDEGNDINDADADNNEAENGEENGGIDGNADKGCEDDKPQEDDKDDDDDVVNAVDAGADDANDGGDDIVNGENGQKRKKKKSGKRRRKNGHFRGNAMKKNGVKRNKEGRKQKKNQ